MRAFWRTILVLFLLTFNVWGQTPAVEEIAPTATPVAAPVGPSGEVEREGLLRRSASEVAPEYATPRATLESFLESMEKAGPLRPDQYLLANRCLDLSSIPRVVREEQGVALSKELHAILTTAVLDFEALKVDDDSTSVVLYQQPSGRRVELVKEKSGRWVFSAQTVADVPEMYQVLTTKGKVERMAIDALEWSFLGLRGNLWVAILILPLIAYGLGSLALLLLRLPAERVLRRRLNLDAQQVKHLLKPVSWLVASLFVWLGLSLLGLPARALVILAIVVKVTACLAVVSACFRASDAASLYFEKITAETPSKFDDMLIPLGRRTFKALVAVIGLLFLAQNLDIEVWSLFAGFSIFGAMVALAGQDMVKNFFGSLTVLLDQPFTVGDWIVTGGVEGVVQDVGFRSTRIRTFQDSLITLPNSLLITASVDNYGARNFRRYSKQISIRWSTPPDKLEAFCEGIREIVRRHPYTRKDSYNVWVNDMNDYALQILVYIFWVAPDWNTELREKHRFLIDLHRLASDLGIEFAYPSQRLILTRGEESFQEEVTEEALEQARKGGRERSGQLLDRTLPEKTPPPAVID